jgi:peptidyl-prolyl cis-trans isomerase C
VGAVAAVLGVIAVIWHHVSGLPSDAAFRVDGVVVTQAELDHRIKILGGLYGLRPPSDPALLSTFQRDAAKSMAESTVLDNQAQAHHIVISDAQAKQELSTMIANLNPPGEASFIQLLQNSHSSEGDVLAEIKRHDRDGQLYSEITAPAVQAVTENAISAYYRQHQATLVVPEQRHLRNIVVATQQEATQLISELHTGADFVAEAKQNSLDQATSDSGGDLGFVPATQLDGPYAQLAFSTPLGAVFGPVQTPDGWNVGQVLEIRPAAPQTLSQAHDSIGDQLRAQAADQAWTSWLDRQISSADIRYAPAYQPANTAPSAAPPGTAGTGPGPSPAGGK